MAEGSRFRYTAMAPDGRTLNGELDAADASGLAAALGQRGLMLVSAEKLRPAGGGLFSSGVDQRKVTSFLAELALMLRSGLPLDEALTLSEGGLSAQLQRVVHGLSRDILGGASFVQALEKHPDVFSRDIVAMARIADATGDLDGVLAAVATQRERTQRLTDTLVGALRYPAFLVVSALGVLVFFLVAVIPQFKGLFADSGQDPGVLVNLVLAMSDGVVDNGTALGAGLAGALLAGLMVWRTPSAFAIAAAAFRRLPVVGATWALWQTTRFLNGLAILLTQGVPLTESLKVLEDTVGTAGRKDLALVSDAVRRGGRLHEALEQIDLVPPVALRMIRIGEDTGELAKVATDAAALYARQLEKRLDAITGLVGPIAILAIAGLIGGMMVTIMSALVSVDQAVL